MTRLALWMGRMLMDVGKWCYVLCEMVMRHDCMFMKALCFMICMYVNECYEWWHVIWYDDMYMDEWSWKLNAPRSDVRYECWGLM